MQGRVHLNSERREKGKHTPQAVEAISLGFEPNTRAYSFFIPEKNSPTTSNQAQFDEAVFPFWRKKVVKQYPSDNSTDILYQSQISLRSALLAPDPILIAHLECTRGWRLMAGTRRHVAVNA